MDVTVTVRLKEFFFDRERVRRAMSETKQRVLNHIGGTIRKIARHSIRPRNNYNLASPPGKPPYSHRGLLRKLILYGYDRSSDSVVIGPVGFTNSNVPNVLEFGGMSTRTNWDSGSNSVVHKRVRIRPRPYMRPALQEELPKIPYRWRGSVRGG